MLDIVGIGLRKAALVDAFVIVCTMAVFHLQAQCGFDEAELFALEPRCRSEQISELEEIQWCHRIQYRYLLVAEFDDLKDPVEPVQHQVHVFGIVVDPFFGKDFPHVVQFKKDLLEP